MRYKMMKKSGALQEGIQKNVPRSAPTSMSQNRPMKSKQASVQQRHRLVVNPEEFDLSERIKTAMLQQDMGITQRIKKVIDQKQNANYGEERKMWSYIIPEGQKVLVTTKKGDGEIIEGPKRISLWGKKVQSLQQHIAYPGEFLIVKKRDGSQQHLIGPQEMWQDPRVHAQIQKEDALQLAGKEAVVVYTKNEEGSLARRIVCGPELFVPEPGEWLHTFSWHGVIDGSGIKQAGGLKFQKLWLMPDQMYHDVADVSTGDDVVLEMKLMIFFELTNVEKMLDETHDPIGDFINAASSDVIDYVGRYTFEELKNNTDKLNLLESYPQLTNRANQCGYKINKVVYRGYATSEALQNMHRQAIETRTKLKLERETEEQQQKLADLRHEREYNRSIESRKQEREQEAHEMEQRKLRHNQDIEIQKEKLALQQDQTKQGQDQKLLFLTQLKDMGVELTTYLTQDRPDKVIELRGKGTSPHLHIDE
ncbi:hypothetical protein [Candidatus Uabimicrobium sp. HlEnr_7]|uniref:hypothetical protein n=1 Tax=Candidatus Uabimicrobium helgolandensis TaxID=3095367 RepID=UPI0035575D25